MLLQPESETKHTHTHTHSPGLQINTFKNSPRAFEWKSSIHMAVRAHTHTRNPEGAQRELTKQETVQREREDFLPATKLINSTVINIMVNFTRFD